MMSQNEVTYTSLPQDEGEEKHTYISTLPSPRDGHDCRVTAITFTVIMVIGTTLAIVLPLTLKKTDAKEEQPVWVWDPKNEGIIMKESEGLSPEDLSSNGGIRGKDKNDKEDFVLAKPAPDKEYNNWHQNTPTTTQPPKISVTNSVELPKKTTTPSKLPGGFVHTTLRPSFQSDDLGQQKKESTTSLPPVVAQPTEKTKEDKDDSSILSQFLHYITGKVGSDVAKNISDLISSQNKTKPSNQTVTHPPKPSVTTAHNLGVPSVPNNEKQSGVVVTTEHPKVAVVINDVNNKSLNVSHLKDSGTKVEDILDNLFPKSNTAAKPGTKDIASWIGGTHSHDTTVALLALMATLLLLGCVIGITCVVHHKMKKQARLASIQSAITDLQSRDKIVLLNSDDSSEEE
ncbi:uncharacterized protein LOC143018789 [Oratosquilla oratoria]|uniref:uncharacterized protein LOC143018789 n=1 Tax=Oratosquilla oratoria TaxID=337810 RepID=UPI003F7768B5